LELCNLRIFKPGERHLVFSLGGVMMRIGYAAINVSLKPLKYRSIRLNTVLTKGVSSLKEIIISNLMTLKTILKWNVENDLYMYRFPSNILPLVTHPDILNSFEWRWFNDAEIKILMSEIRMYVNDHRIRLTTHPDQFIVINSINSDVVKSSVSSLEDTCMQLSLMGGSDCIIHVGGVYGNKEEAIKRFILNYKLLSKRSKSLIRIENDDKSYTVSDVLSISKQTKIPVVFDIHHHRCLVGTDLSEHQLKKVILTWNGLRPKCHVSSGKVHVSDRSHAMFITEKDVIKAFELFSDNFDIMIEAKQKDKAALQFKDHYQAMITQNVNI
jgi:UV DNA damage endonuclease